MSGTTISQNGGIIYIQQSGANIQYQRNSTSGAWTTISSWPATFINSNPVSGNILTVQLNTNIIISSTQGTNGFFSTGSNYITYDGSTSNYIVTISGLTSYTGLIRNGTSATDGYHTVTVQNIKSAASSSTLSSYSAWICQSYFGKNIKNAVGYNPTTNLITINNCSNSATISTSFTGFICGRYFGYNANATITNCFNTGTNGSASNTGGIVGANLADSLGTVTISNCYSTSLIGSNGGGIVGIQAASNGGNVTISNCYNTGTISGSTGNGGGIVGYQAASNNGTITISNCYNTGSNNGGTGGGGGIAGQQFGYNTNNTCTISNCYNIGSINTTSTTVGGGGICGKQAGNNTSATYTPTIVISNCYNLGTIAALCSGILGGQESTNSNTPNITITNCYSAYTSNAGSAITSMVQDIPNNWPTPTQTSCYDSLISAWSDTAASSALTGYPTSLYVNNPGTTWSSVATNTPYLLSAFNSQIYTPNTTGSSVFNYTSSDGLFSGSTYSLVSVNNAVVPSNVSISGTTGVLTVTNNNSGITTYVNKVFVYKGTAPNYNAYNFNTFTLNYNVISQNSGTIYIQQSGANIQYQSNSTSGTWTTISDWPVIFTNSNPVSGNILTVQLTTNITVSATQGLNGYFSTGSNYITYDGANYTVTISGLTNYPGLIQNGTSTSDGYHTVTVQNIKSATSSSTITNSGWICQSYFGKNIKNAVGYNAVTNLITVTNCSNSGILSSFSGGICGSYFGYNADATITNCFNTGTLSGGSTAGIVGANLADSLGTVTISNCYNTSNINTNGGGIVGIQAASNNGNVTITNCYNNSTSVGGGDSGGIVGYQAAINNGTITITNCYNTGAISGNGGGGGIAGRQFGTNTNNTCSISNCYNIGAISTTSTTVGGGGICGKRAGFNNIVTYTPTIVISNCYNLGTIGSLCSGILGGQESTNSNTPNITITNCYSAYTSNAGSEITSMVENATNKWPTPTQTSCYSTLQSAWSDTNASSALTGTPTSVTLYLGNTGTTWTSVSPGTPYVLSSYNSEIYTPNVYSNPTLPSYTTIPGSFSSADGYTYSLVSANTDNVSINSATGALTFTNLQWSFSYTANVLASKGSAPSYTAYNVSTYTLNNVYCFKEGTKILCFTDKEEYIPIQDLKPGNLVKTVSSGFKKIEHIGNARVYYDIKKNGRIKQNLYKLCKTDYPELFEDLIITGCHSILVDEFVNEEQRNKTIEVNGNTYLTENYYRLPACADNKSKIYEVDDVHVVYHFSLENTDYFMNYGVYANGLLVETTSNRMMKELACLNPIHF